MLIVLLGLSKVAHKLVHDVYWHREDNSAVILRRDTVESLQVSQLEYGYWIMIFNFIINI